MAGLNNFFLNNDDLFRYVMEPIAEKPGLNRKTEDENELQDWEKELFESIKDITDEDIPF